MGAVFSVINSVKDNILINDIDTFSSYTYPIIHAGFSYDAKDIITYLYTYSTMWFFSLTIYWIWQVNFTGLTGKVSFDDNLQRKNVKLDVLQLSYGKPLQNVSIPLELDLLIYELNFALSFCYQPIFYLWMESAISTVFAKIF